MIIVTLFLILLSLTCLILVIDVNAMLELLQIHSNEIKRLKEKLRNKEK